MDDRMMADIHWGFFTSWLILFVKKTINTNVFCEYTCIQTVKHSKIKIIMLTSINRV